MSFLKILVCVLLFTYCFKAKKSPYDSTTPRGLVYQISIDTAIRNSKTVTTPTFSLEPGVYSSNITISISTLTENAIIHYTTDDTEPNKDSPTYITPISLNGHGSKITIKAFAEKEGLYDSSVKSGNWEIKYNPAGTPNVQYPSSGKYNTPQFLTLSSETSNAKIYYTIDGSEPSSSSYLYTHPIGIWSLLGRVVTIKSIAIAESHLDSPVVTTTVGPYQMPPLKTGQTECWDNSGNLIAACTSSPQQDGALQKGIPRSYTDNNDGTVTDNVTGLVWQKCSRGQNEDSNCSGTAITSSFIDSESYCLGLNLANKQWRIPTFIELQTLADYGSSQGINTTYFPNSQDGYWTATLHADGSNRWKVGFHNSSLPGWANASGSTPNYTRCVSGPKRESIPNNQNFTDNGDGTLTDKSTGLTWQKCISGQTWSSVCSGQESAASLNNAYTSCTGAWRLPNINELESILDITKPNPFLDLTVFPSLPYPPGIFYGGGGLWSSTTNMGNRANALLLVAQGGRIDNNTKSTAQYGYRCVKD